MTSTCAEAAGNQLSRNDAKDVTRGCHMDSPLLDNQHVERKIIITHNGLQVIETSRNPHRSHLQLRRPLLDASTTVRILVRSKLCEEVLYRRVNQIIPRGYKLAQLYKSDDAGAADMALFELKILPARHQHAPPDVPPLNLLDVLQPKKGSLCTTYDGTRTCLPMTAPGYLENNLDYTKLHKVFTGQWPFDSSKEDVTGVLHCILPEHIVAAIVRIEKLPNKKRTLEACEQRSKPSSYHLYVDNADAVRFLISHEQMTYRCNAFMVITKDPERRYGAITFSHASSTFRHATAINQEKEVATTTQL